MSDDETRAETTKRKKRPTPTPTLQGGKTATGVPNYSEMTREQINDAMVERARSGTL